MFISRLPVCFSSLEAEGAVFSAPQNQAIVGQSVYLRLGLTSLYPSGGKANIQISVSIPSFCNKLTPILELFWYGGVISWFPVNVYRISALYIQYIVSFLCVITVYHTRIFQQKAGKKQEKKSCCVYLWDVINNSLVFADVS